MPRPLKRGMLGNSTIIPSKDIVKYAFICGSNFYETNVKYDFLLHLIEKEKKKTVNLDLRIFVL